jgi:hypothetical protein
MNLFFILVTAATITVYALYNEKRKLLRLPILMLIGLNILIYFSPHVRCAVNISPTSYMTFDWKVINFQYDFCLKSDSIKENLGIDI